MQKITELPDETEEIQEKIQKIGEQLKVQTVEITPNALF